MSVTVDTNIYSREEQRRDEVPYGTAVYNSIMTFLIKEARLLDHRKLVEWGELLAQDLEYKAPVRVTRRVQQFDVADEYEVSSYLLLTRNRAEAKDYKQLIAERNDRLRMTKDGFHIARRSIMLDQVVLGMPNFAIFL